MRFASAIDIMGHGDAGVLVSSFIPSATPLRGKMSSWKEVNRGKAGKATVSGRREMQPTPRESFQNP